MAQTEKAFLVVPLPPTERRAPSPPVPRRRPRKSSQTIADARHVRRAQMSTGGEPSVSKKSSVRFLVVLLCVPFTTAALVFADLVVIAQNTNSSTTQDESMNANMATPRRG